MQVLLESDSLIQFIIATHLRTTVFKDDDVDLIMYNSMPMAKNIFVNIEKSGMFNRCYLVESVLAVGKNKLTRLQKIEKGIRWLEMLALPIIGTKRIVSLDNYYYDVFVFCANGIFLDGLYNVCLGANPNMKCYRYEGSLTSYLYDHENAKGKYRDKLERIVKRLFKKSDVIKYVERYYFFEPTLIQFKHRYNIVRIDKITSMPLYIKKMLNDIFEFDITKNYISESVIVFEDGNMFYMNNDEEVPIYTKASEIVGHNNLLVKIHPRTVKNRYPDEVKTSKNVAPWEIYMLNQNMDGKTLITCASGSIFTSLLYFGMRVNVIMIYKCIHEKIPLINDHFQTLIKQLALKNKNNILSFPESPEELYTLLKSILGN